MGLAMTAVVAAMVAGAASAKLLFDAGPFVASTTAAGLCGGLFVLARLFARSAPTHFRFIGLLGLACLTFAYLLVLGGEATPRPVSRSAPAFLAVSVLLLGIVVVAVAVPAVLVAAALRRRGGETSPPSRWRAGPQLIATALGAATLVLGFALLAVVMWASPRPWRLAAVLLVVIGSPLLLVPFWAYTYERLLSWWEVTRLPDALLDGLETLRDRIGFTFDGILCLEATFGGGRVCQVVTRPGGSTLVVSEPLAAELTMEQLFAVLAHEAAHIRLHHLRRKLLWGTLAGAVAVSAAVAAQIAIAPFVPRSLDFAGVLVVVLPLGILRGLYDTFVVRRHEAEADEFAVEVAGAAPLLGALGVLGALGPSGALVHNRWTTHSTAERRASMIRACSRGPDSLEHDYAGRPYGRRDPSRHPRRC